MWTNTLAPFIGLGTILINKCPKYRTLTKDLSILKQNGNWRNLIIPVIPNRSPWGTYTKVFENFIQTYFTALCELSCYDVIILHNRWVHFLELIMYLGNKPLWKFLLLFGDRLYVQARSCFKEVTWNSKKALHVLYACSKSMF